MLPASNRGAGMSMGFPDVCLTPAVPAPIPVPYPNLAMNAQAAPFAATVMISMMPGLNMASAIPLTMGDEAGTAHPFFMQRAAYTMGNPVVFIEKLPAINLTAPTTGNMMNNALGAVLVPSVTNVFLTLRGEDCATLSERLEAPLAVREQWLDKIGFLRISVFEAKTPSRIYSAIRRLSELGLEKLVIDLRGNPGGDLSACTAILCDFFPEGTVLYQLEDADGDREVVRARGKQLYEFPIELWVDRNTGSAAEVFAATVQAHRRGRILGERTFGKSTVHQVVAATEHGQQAIALHTGTVFLPDGSPLHGAGVTPDEPLG